MSNLLHLVWLIVYAVKCFTDNFVVGINVNEYRVNELLNGSLMLVTALKPHIEYDNASDITKLAHKNILTLKEGDVESVFLMAEPFDKWIDPEEMIGPKYK